MSHTPTAFDKVADKFWQDYQNGVPIGGGMAFEAQVRACNLDETTDSLKALDRLLIAIKDKLPTDEKTLLAQKEFRNFVLFVGFYAGRVVANYHPKITFHWLSFDELKEQYSLSERDKFYKMSALCPDVKNKPFFVWLTVGARFFGGINRKFNHPVTGQVMPESLYWAVQAYFDELSLVENKPTEDNQSSQPKQNQPVATPPATLQSILTTPIQADNIGAILTTPITLKSTPKKATPPPPKDPFDEIKVDLVNLPAQNSSHNEHYLRANDFLNKADKAVQGGATLDTAQQVNVVAALNALQKVADTGNTNAMLALAIYAFEKRLLDDTPRAVALVQRSAEMGDVRGQKLLSRLYYQGLGVQASTEMGQLWLDRAAAGGHEEAKKLQSQMRLVKAMKKEQHSEVAQDKRMYGMLIGVGMVFLIMMWLFAKMMAK